MAKTAVAMTIFAILLRKWQKREVSVFTIENCGTPDCHLVLTKADASASHPPIDESNTMADSQLPTEVECNLFFLDH